jgi:hypothetical protein
VDEICLNLSSFNRRGHVFPKFLELIEKELPSPPSSDETLPRPKRHVSFKVQFESTLRTVSFPDLDRIHDASSQTTFFPVAQDEDRSRIVRWQDEPVQLTVQSRTSRRDEVPRVLKWLKDVKNVTRIVQLSVEDSFENPHTEETIENAIMPFDIRILKWKRLDLSIDSILCSAKNVEHLYLYSSGNRAALTQWLGDCGVRRLDKV